MNDWLETETFYHLMYMYRTIPQYRAPEVVDAYEEVKHQIRMHLKEIERDENERK